VRPRRTTQVGRKARIVARHGPIVALRSRLSMTCGNCHGCKQTPPSIKPLPERPPFQVGPRRKPLDGWPWRPERERPGPMVRLPGPQLRPLVGPPPVPLDFVVPKPRPGPELPALDPPALPPLGVVKIGEPRRPALERMIGARPDRPSSLADAPEKPRSGVETSPPPLPVLEGSVTQLSPLLAQKEGTTAPFRAPARSFLPPEQVVVAPGLAPLPGLLPHAQGLLPTLDSDDPPEAFDPSGRPTLAELTLRPPPLPPLLEVVVP
jgi:hypothetical protein